MKIFEMFKDKMKDFSLMRLMTVIVFINLIFLLCVHVTGVAIVPVTIFTIWFLAAVSPQTLQTFIENAYHIEDIEGVGGGFFDDEKGNLDPTRVMSFILLIFAIVYNDAFIFMKREIDMNILLMLMCGAYFPKLLLKISEKSLTVTKESLNQAQAKAVESIKSNISESLVPKLAEGINNTVNTAIENKIKEFIPGTNTALEAGVVKVSDLVLRSGTKYLGERLDHVASNSIDAIQEGNDIGNSIKEAAAVEGKEIEGDIKEVGEKITKIDASDIAGNVVKNLVAGDSIKEAGEKAIGEIADEVLGDIFNNK